jgi:RNA polymerase subunit RPABC4/transcription elongation factor Spt4
VTGSASGEPPVVPVETCPHCANLVPVGAFCGNCGAHLADRSGRNRLHAFAAAPGEHVVRPAVVSTLFARLPLRHAHAYREALGAGVLIVVVLAALRLYTSALIAAALLLPILALLYLYEIEQYDRDPVTVLAATFGSGVALGVFYTLVIGRLITASLEGTQQGPVITAVLLPVFVQVLMAAGPLLLLWRTTYSETLDGLTFGVSTALGFTLASVLAGYWQVFTSPLLGSASVGAEDVLRLLRAGILVALVNACTTAMITAGLWLNVHGRSRRRHLSQWRALPVNVAAAFGAQIGLGLIGYYTRSILELVVVWAVAAVALLIWLRWNLHYALLEEGAELRIGEPSACPECHRLVPTMLFCPVCGVARSAGPQQPRPASPQASPDAV